jgi:hypothetical protein
LLERSARVTEEFGGGSLTASAINVNTGGTFGWTAGQLNTTENGDGVACPAGTASRNRSPSLVTAQSASAPGTWNRTL